LVSLLLKFVSCSRTAGLRVSTSEVLDCLNQLELVDPLDELQFASVLRANFAKSRREQAKFDRLYHLFFHELRQEPNIGRSEPLVDQIHKVLTSLAATAAADASYQAVLAYLGGEPGAFLDQMNQALSGGSSAPGYFGAALGAVTRRLNLLLQLGAVRESLQDYLDEHRREIHWEARRDLMAHFNDRLDSARRLLLQNPPVQELDDSKYVSHRRHLSRLGEVHFASLTPKEVEEMREVIEQLVRRLKDAVGRRYAVLSRGVLDVKRTLRRAARYQGVPMEIVCRRRPPRKAKIVALCDVSGSVWSAARFMLNILYSLQECFTQVRSFIFVAGLQEVTRIFQTYEINQAIEKVLTEAEIDYNAATDYGLTFRQFKRHYLDVLNKKTTLIIIGDGRSNYTNPEEGILEQMRERSRRVIWLNPETQQFWYTGDSEMRSFQAHCDEVRPCQNLNQLVEFIRSLVL
jgi:uncharacterized protein